MKRSQAFKQIIKEGGRKEGTVAVNYYYVAKKRGGERKSAARKVAMKVVKGTKAAAPKKAGISATIYDAIEKLVAGAKMTRAAAFRQHAKATGRKEGTVAVNYYYYAAKKRGAKLAKRGPGRPKAVVSATRNGAGSSRIESMLKSLAELARSQESELASLRRDNERLAALRTLVASCMLPVRSTLNSSDWRFLVAPYEWASRLSCGYPPCFSCPIQCSSRSSYLVKWKQQIMSDMAMFLGAGFSHVAGLPLANDLFDTLDLPPAFSHRAAISHEEVRRAWLSWTSRHPNAGAEQWLREIWDRRPFTILGTSWENALLFALARLVPDHAVSTPYYHGISNSVESEIHRSFWRLFLQKRFRITCVVTTNYDLLAEQGMRNEYTAHRTAPLCHYGGFPYSQVVRKMTDRRSGAHEKLELGHHIALYKLHGSINWADEPHGFKIHEDCRAAFRSDSSKGEVAIVPPLPEKQRPDWLAQVWQHAERALAASDRWLVCGYSLPDYDIAIHKLLSDASARVRGTLHVWILDPNSEDVRQRWARVCRAGTRFVCLPGLPTALSEEHWHTFDN